MLPSSSSTWPLPRSIIFDLGDVLFTWSANTTTTIHAHTIRKILSSATWHDYERGQITRDMCFERVGQEFSLPASEIAEAFAQARASLEPDGAVVTFLRELKDDPAIKVYAMSNIGAEDFAELGDRMDWELFEDVFTSAAAGLRKPEVGFYRHVLDRIHLSGEQVAFVDDKEENVRAAESLGMRGLVFGDDTVQTLRDMFYGTVGKGWRFLFRNKGGCFGSTTDGGVRFADNFAKLLILDTLQDRSLVDVSWRSRQTWNFFTGETALIPGGQFPDDLDTTSLALSALRPTSPKFATSVLDQMAEYINDDGTFQTYFDRDRPRVDPIVSANVLASFYTFDRGHEFEPTLQLIRTFLLNREYAQGTRYYPSPDCCLGFVGRLLRTSNDVHLHMTLGPLLTSRIAERRGLEGSALDLAMRVITCVQMGVACADDYHTLLSLQRADGGWNPGWMYRYGSTGVRIGNQGVTTAMAVKAAACYVTAFQKRTSVGQVASVAEGVKSMPGVEVALIPVPLDE